MADQVVLTDEERDGVCKRCGRGVSIDRALPGRCARWHDDDYRPRCYGSARRTRTGGKRIGTR